MKNSWSLSRSLSRPLSGSGLDAEISAFVAASGATSTKALDNLARYIRAQGLMPYVRCYPMKSAQNKGSGSTVYGWGGLTPNHLTLVNSPTWGASGIVFNGTSQIGRVADFTSTATISVFIRANASANTTVLAAYFGQHDALLTKRSLYFGQRGDQPGDPLGIIRSLDGGSTNMEAANASTTGIGSDTTFSAQWIAGGGRSLWVNKVNQSLSVTTSQTQRYDSDQDWTIAGLAASSPGSFTAMTATAWLFIQTSITDSQREAITDFLNAL